MSGLHVWNQQCLSTTTEFYDVKLKNYLLVLCVKRGRGLNHSGRDAEGESFNIELQVRAKCQGGRGVLRISVDGDDRMGVKI